MDVVLYTDSNVSLPLNAYTRVITSVNRLFEKEDLHFILYSLDESLDNEILIELINNLKSEYNKNITANIILRPIYINENTPNNNVGRNVTVEDDGLFSQLQVLQHDKVLFIRMGDGISSDVLCKKDISRSYDVSGLLIKTSIIKKLFELVKLDNQFINGEMLRLLVDTFVDDSEINYYQIYKDVYWSENRVHKESLWDLYNYLVHEIYPKAKHNDQYTELCNLRSSKDCC